MFFQSITELMTVDKDDLLALLSEYSDYVVHFNEDHDEGCNPVSLLEYANNDFEFANHNALSFVNDVDKMIDFVVLSKEEFLDSYSYLTEEEYNETLIDYNQYKGEVLADLMREAENLHLEEMNGKPIEGPVTSESIKTNVSKALKTLTKAEMIDFEDCCNAMAI